MKTTRRLLTLAAALAAAACGSGGDDYVVTGDDGSGETIVTDGTREWEETGYEAPDTPPPEVPTDPAWETVCYEEGLPLEYEVTSDVLIVLDRSGSMMGTLDNVKNAVNAIVSASDDKIWFGLHPFPSSVPPQECKMINPFSQCYASSAPAVPLGAGRAPEIASHLSGLGICGSTPTTETLEAARAYLASAATGHTKYVLLATDGVPNCNASLDGTTCECLDTETGCASNPEACLDDAACLAAIDDLFGDGVKTYVLGMGASLSAYHDVMSEMAARGGTGDWYPAERPGELLAVFEAIMGTIVVSCRFDLTPPGEDIADPEKVNLYVGGTVVPQDDSHTNGWDYVDEDTVEFYGPICDTILSGDVAGVSASYGCPTWVI